MWFNRFPWHTLPHSTYCGICGGRYPDPTESDAFLIWKGKFSSTALSRYGQSAGVTFAHLTWKFWNVFTFTKSMFFWVQKKKICVSSAALPMHRWWCVHTDLIFAQWPFSWFRHRASSSLIDTHHTQKTMLSQGILLHLNVIINTLLLFDLPWQETQ